MKKEMARLMRRNVRLAQEQWSGELGPQQLQVLKILTEVYAFVIALGDLLFLDGKWYVTHAGLLRLAQRRQCVGIKVQQVREFCDPTVGRWVFKATLHKRAQSEGFVGFGDADPSNVSSAMRGAELRIAETRAVNRALRKAYGIGLCSVEELGTLSSLPKSSTHLSASTLPHSSNGSGNGQPRLRDQLCLLIRQYNLDPTLVKAYAADFCGTKTLSEASRDSVESFIALLARSAKQNRESLVCKLNSYAQPQEVHS